MKFIKYIRSEYKSWLIGVLILPLVIGFENSFSVFKYITEISHTWILVLRILCLIFIASFFVFSIFLNEFEFHEKLGEREYDSKDLNRFKRNLKKALTVYSITLLIWIVAILIIFFDHVNAENIWRMIYILTLPMVIIGLMIYMYSGIKTAYNTV